MSSLLLLLVAAAPAVALMTFFYLRDRYEREPLHHVAGAFLLGMYAMIAAKEIAETAEGWVSREWLKLGGELPRLFDAFVLAGLVEEVAKLVILAGAVYHWDEFDERLDGLVYGVAVALGFATLENFMYLERYGLGVAWQRAVFAVPAHALFGGTMGYYIGRVKFTRPGLAAQRWLDRVLALALPVLFHGLYNYALAHRLDWKIWASVVTLSFGFWLFVLRRLYRAQRASPYRPKTIAPFVPGDPNARR